MNLTLRLEKMSMPLALTWTALGVTYRVTPWPETRFERVCGDQWTKLEPTAAMLAAADHVLGFADWKPYLEFTPRDVREFVARFPSLRMTMLQVAARCPALLTALLETPALAPFIADHAALRGNDSPQWGELNAVNERSGVFGVLAWLGLPASRQTLAILHNVSVPELPRPWLEPLRAQLWDTRCVAVLRQLPAISGHQLAEMCHALAA